MKKGLYLVLGTAIISGISVFVNKFGISALGNNPYQYATLKNIVVALILSIFIFTPLIWPKLKRLNKKDWAKLILIGLIGGSIPFLLFFKGLSLTSPVSAAFLHKTLFIWVAILAWPILKEKLSELQIWALILLVLGNVIFLNIKSMSWGYAETLILIATIFWAVENIIAKFTLKNVPALVVAWGRMFFGAIFLSVFLMFTGGTLGLFNLTMMQFGWLALVAIFLTGYVVTWYSALRRLPVVVVASFLVLASPITTFLNAIFITHTIDYMKILGAAVMVFAVFVFYKFRCVEMNQMAEVKN